jgi:hypothetical protein
VERAERTEKARGEKILQGEISERKGTSVTVRKIEQTEYEMMKKMKGRR